MFADLEHIAGIDFGSRTTGTTAFCMLTEGEMRIYQSKKGEDADSLLTELIERFGIRHVFIDAPLSLPHAYYNKGDDFMYRRADRDIKAMSPMFLGGLTARAIQLKNKWHSLGVECTEVYPGGWVRQYEASLEKYLKKQSAQTGAFMGFLKKEHAAIHFPEADNWHQVDSMICWLIGQKYLQGQAIAFGDPDEGQIWI